MINVFDLSCFRNPFAKFDQGKGLEGKIGAGSQIKGLKQTLFRIVPTLLNLSLPVLESIIWITFLGGHFNFIQG